VGKTLASAIVCEALRADYWKPVQAGFDDGTDRMWVAEHTNVNVHPEIYRLKLPASPHIAARRENIRIDIDRIANEIPASNKLVIEGAGGLMVPLNDHQFVYDLVKALKLPVILVSRNYLGSINHSLLTAGICRQHNIEVLGWIFNDHFMDYEDEIVKWTGIPRIASIPATGNPDREFVRAQAEAIRKSREDIAC